VDGGYDKVKKRKAVLLICIFILICILIWSYFWTVPILNHNVTVSSDIPTEWNGTDVTDSIKDPVPLVQELQQYRRSFYAAGDSTYSPEDVKLLITFESSDGKTNQLILGEKTCLYSDGRHLYTIRDGTKLMDELLTIYGLSKN